MGRGWGSNMSTIVIENKLKYYIKSKATAIKIPC